ncbi:MAG: S8 family serine peptidase [Candidatus Mariimomonas ferrooxydans]
MVEVVWRGGVNWNLKIMPLKFLNSYGQGSTIDAIRAILYAIDMGADITSNSWGGGGFSHSLKDTIQMASDADLLFIAAAGNDGTDNDSYPHYPSNYDVPNVISVAATDHNDDLAWFSNYGETTVDLAAPGEDIFSTFPPGVYLSSSCNDNDGDGYGYCSGTSMATPHVAGVAALLKGYNPALSALDNKNLIMNSVDPVESLAGRTVTGGRLNANSALMIAGPDWIRVNGELSGQILPGFSTDLTVLLDAAGKTAGDYEAEITIVSNDPVNSVKVVPVTMTVLSVDTYSISGTVNKSGRGGGGPLTGVTITLSGAGSGTTTTDASGNYTFSGLSNGSYKVKPGLSGYRLSPKSRAVTISEADVTVTGQDFTAKPSKGKVR